jgi:hypothetical protein
MSKLSADFFATPEGRVWLDKLWKDRTPPPTEAYLATVLREHLDDLKAEGREIDPDLLLLSRHLFREAVLERGARPKEASEKSTRADDIQRDYRELVDSGTKPKDAVTELAARYKCVEQTIRNHVRRKKAHK